MIILVYLFFAFIIVTVLNYSVFNGKKTLRYRNWYRPWLATLWVCIMPFFREDIENSITKIIPLVGFSLEIGYCIHVTVTWVAFKSFLQLSGINDFAESLLKKHNTNSIKLQKRGFANYLVWPYYIEGFAIFKRPGFTLYKYMLRGFLLTVLIIYALAIYYFKDSRYLVPTAFGLLLIPVITEWLIYFTAEVKSEIEDLDEEEKEDKNINFYNLFKRYVNKEHGFRDSVIFGYIKNQKSQWEKQVDDNLKYINDTVNKSIFSNTDFIVSTNDFTSSIPKFSALFFDALKKGGNILLLADIPDHTKYKPFEVGMQYGNNNELESISKIFSVYLEQTFEHSIPTARSLMDIGYYDEKDKSGLKKRILLTNIRNGLDDQLIHSDWIKELDLVVVLQFNDAYVDNLLIQRKFSLWLDQQSITYKTVLFKIYRTSGDESFTNTWITSKNPEETKLKNVTTADRNYFLNFAYEKSQLNTQKIFQGDSYQYDFSPGIELSVFAIMENIGSIQFFEGYNLDYIQSKNKLVSSQSALKSTPNEPKGAYNYASKVTQHLINQAILVNNLPFIVRPFDKFYCSEKHLSVVYDIENNAPKLYQKYRHLGLKESFICIVSKPHLFRDFFAEQISYFTDNTLEALAPQLSKAKINLCLQLFHLLMHEKISISYIQHLLNQHSVKLKEISVVDFIASLFKRYLHLEIRENSILKYSKHCVFKDGKYQTDQRLTIDKQVLETNDVFNYLEDITIVDGGQNTLLVLPKYLLFQNILPQQNIIINGTSYEYVNFNENTRELVLNATKTEAQTFYKPTAHIKVSNTEIKEIDAENKREFFAKGKPHTFQLSILEREMSITYDKYFAFEKYYHSPFASQNTPTCITLSEDFKESSQRKYLTRYLKLEWELIDSLKAQKEKIVTQLHHLLYEFLPILLPYRYQYVQVLSNNSFSKAHREKTPWVFPTHNIPTESKNAVEIYLVEDSFSDLGILKSVQLYFEYIIKNLYDLLLWLQDDREYFSTDYTEFVKGEAFAKEKLQFLRYGLPKRSSSWDINLLLEFIRENAFFDSDNLNENHKKRSSKANLNITVACDYCKTVFNLAEVDVMEDGLHRCANCSVGAVDLDGDVETLEQEAKELYIQHMGIDFSSDKMPYTLNFVTATELHDYFNEPFYVTNKYDERIVVGLATDRELDAIYIEKHLKKPATLSTIIHEMMHIFQYQRLNFFKMKNSEPELIEGMTTWTEYLLLTKSGNPEYVEYAKFIDSARTADQSEYGIGYRYVKKHYGEEMVSKVLKKYSV